jgi:hypothetical protein
MRIFDERDGERMPRESYVMRTPGKMAEVIASVDPFQAKPEPFFRGSRPINPVNHIVIVETRNGAKLLRRTALTADQMAQVEVRLMEQKHQGQIRDYTFTAAEDCGFPDLLAWVESFGESAEQQQLLSVEQDSLFR